MFGDTDSDGFYHGESGGLSGYVPSNMVAEIPVNDDYLKHLLMQQGFLPVDHTGISHVIQWVQSGPVYRITYHSPFSLCNKCVVIVAQGEGGMAQSDVEVSLSKTLSVSVDG